MILLCGECNELKDYHAINLHETFHPYNVGTCYKCEGNVFEVDELIAPTIIELNKKGWATQFCCSGHLDDYCVATYIKFKNLPETVPTGFYIDGDCIRVNSFKRKRLTGIEGFNELVRLNRNMYKWALRLPVREGDSNGNKRFVN